MEAEKENNPELDALMAADEVIDRLKPITEDAKLIEGYGDSNWLLKIVGDQQPFNLVAPGQEGNVTNYSTIVLKNLYWQGAVTVANYKNYVNFYIGYGLKDT